MLWQRWASEWRLKLALGGLLTAAFWVFYAWTGRRPAAHVVVVPALAIDRALPLVPAAAWIYVSQFLTTPIVLYLAASRRAVLGVAGGVSLMASVSFLVYFLVPTCVEREVASGVTNAAYRLVIGGDVPRNACPSLHAGFAVFLSACAWALSGGLAHRWAGLVIFWLWTLAVLVSTIVIRQHVVIDLAAGGLLGAVCFCVIYRSLGGAEAIEEKPVTTKLGAHGVAS